MSDPERLPEAKLQNEIEELRAELGETVEALVHKVDVPARAQELKEETRERVKERAAEAAERAREVVERTPKSRWAMMAGAGLVLIALTVIVRKVRA